jgi:hypothetical protein
MQENPHRESSFPWEGDQRLGGGGLEHAPGSHGSQNSLKIGVVKPQKILFLISYSSFLQMASNEVQQGQKPWDLRLLP